MYDARWAGGGDDSQLVSWPWRRALDVYYLLLLLDSSFLSNDARFSAVALNRRQNYSMAIARRLPPSIVDVHLSFSLVYPGERYKKITSNTTTVARRCGSLTPDHAKLVLLHLSLVYVLLFEISLVHASFAVEMFMIKWIMSYAWCVI